jgi:hypothetical protein
MVTVMWEVKRVVVSSSLLVEDESDVTIPPFDEVELGAEVFVVDEGVPAREEVIAGVATVVKTHEQADEMRDGEPAQCET